MTWSWSRGRGPSHAVSWAASLLVAALWLTLRIAVFHSFVFPLTYVVPLLIGVWTRDKAALWAMAVLFAVAHTVQQLRFLPANALPDYADIATYAATLFNILVGAVAVHVMIVLRERVESSLSRLEAQSEELAQQNEELAEQGEELSAQAEEMSNQAEELSQQMEEASRQNEELQIQAEEIRSLNVDLQHRGQLLEALLDSARVSGTEAGALQEICASGAQMLGRAAALVAVYEKEGARLVLRAAGGPEREGVAAAAESGSFADLVVQENRTACLDDASLRPDLAVTGAEGRPRFASVLGAPLQSDGAARGALLVYGRVAQQWTDQQFRVAEWLARQCTSILQLLRLQEALREADVRKNEFLATLSHELRNPLAPIRYALELLAANPTGAAAAQSRQVIERQLSHLVRLVDDLLDMTRIASNKIRLRKERVDLGRIVHSAVEAAMPEIRRAGHELSVALPPAPVWLDADADRLAQVLTNLLINAARYTSGSGHIALRAAVDGGEALTISVSDTGVGLCPDDLTRVFEMFTQVGDEGHGGLGIGLALVKGLVELHGGSVEARSDGLGQGSEFRVRLPLAPDERPQAAAAPANAAAPRGHRILVVDDNVDSSEMLRTLLEYRGHQVRVAYDAHGALSAMTEFTPEIGLFDIGLPDMSGYELAKRVRESVGRSMFLVAITGWGQEEDRRKARDHGFDAHLTKPADPEQLEGLIAAACVHPGVRPS